MNQFPFLQSRLEGMEERNDSISSQEECQDLGYTKGKEKTEGNVALLREA